MGDCSEAVVTASEVEPNEQVVSASDSSSADICENGGQGDGGLFVYLCNHISQTTDALRKDIDRLKANTLTVMSFCFLGEVTFVATSYGPLTNNLPALVLVTVAFALWLSAFSITLIIGKGDGYHIVPGRVEGLSFLPYPDEVKSFEESNADPFNADIELAKRALLRFDEAKYCMVNDESVVKIYNEAIRSNNDLLSFNKNAWLAELSQMLRGQKKHYNDVLRFYKALHIVFVVSIACVVASMFVLWYTQFAASLAC